jgi:hypothetical protein
MQQFRDSFTPYRRDNAELGKVSSDRINHRGLLAFKQLCCLGVCMLALVTPSQIASASAVSFF